MTMKASKRWMWLVLVGILVVSILAIGCGKELSGTVTVAGSTTVQP
jgi:ABC-type phosphate transport system substrate-binding protein